MPTRYFDLAASSFLALFGAWVIHRAFQYGITSDAGPDSGAFPLIAGSLVAVFSTLNLVRQISGPRAVEGRILGAELAKIAGTIALVLVYLEAAGLLGMFLPMPFLIMLVSLCVFWRVDTAWLLSLAAISLSMTVVCYFIFAVFLNILLPAGPLGF